VREEKKRSNREKQWREESGGGEAEELSYGFAEDNDQDHDKPACPREYARVGLYGGSLRVQAQEWREQRQGERHRE